MEDTINSYDLIVIGGGPAGLSAAIYGGRAKLRTLLINKGTIGGMADATREIVNYPGYINVSGPDLMRDFKKHAENFGVEFLKDEVVSTDFAQDIKKVTTKKKIELCAKAVVIAVGCEPRLLNIPGEKELRGSGVAYCATCDAEFFAGEDVVVIGSGDQAVEESMFIAKFARNAFNNESLEFSTLLEEVNLELSEGYKVEKMDMATKKTLAKNYGVEQAPSVLVIDKGLEIKRLNCTTERERLKDQLLQIQMG